MNYLPSILPSLLGPCVLAATSLLAALAGQGAEQVQRTDGVPTITTHSDRGALLIAADVCAPVQLPGVRGALALDPATVGVLHGRRNLGVDLVARLRALPGQRLAYQRLELTPEGVAHLSPPLVVSLHDRPRQEETEAQCRARAEQFVASVTGTAMAPRWPHATLGPARPLYRPDVDGAAYYEFAVEPSGYVVASTGAHDRPVAQWTDVGTTPTATLASRTEAAVARVYKLDTLSFVAEDGNGQLVAQLADLPQRLVPRTDREAFDSRPWGSWQQLKQDYRATYLPFLEDQRMDCAVAWLSERTQVVGPQNWSSWSYWYAGGDPDQRCYDQWVENGCWIGCGPVAWAMLFGWVDYRAAVGDWRFAHQWGTYRVNGGFGANAVAPKYNDFGIQNVVREIRSYVGTFCSFGSGATLPSSMIEAWRYGIGRAPLGVRVNYNLAGTPIWYCNDAVEASIKYRGVPVIMGTGFLSHYPLAYVFAERSRQVLWWFEYEKWTFVNQGWGGRENTWVPAGSWFSGEVL